MLRHLTVLLLVFAVAAVASAQTATKTAQQGNPTTQTFIDLENKWNDALVKADTVALAAILADGYVSTDEQGHQRDNRAYLHGSSPASANTSLSNYQTCAFICTAMPQS